MNTLKKTLGFAFTLFLFTSVKSNNSCTSSSLKDAAANMGVILDDTLIFFTTATCCYTVDTPEDQGLLTTDMTIEKLAGVIHSKNGSNQSYKVITSSGKSRITGKIESGDQLKVISSDGKHSRIYTIKCRKAALSGTLQLYPREITNHTTRDLTLLFTAGQRTPDATIRIFIPKEITITKDRVTVNVIGRGAILLKELEKQPIGRTGSDYSYSSVGHVEIAETDQGETTLILRNLDLRPANGADLEIIIRNVNFLKAGDYTFGASYVSSQPERLSSAGLGTERATLRVKKTISDFVRVSDANYTQGCFKWAPLKNGANIQLMKSMDEGKTWKVIPAEIDEANATARISGLDPDRLYTFRLWVRNGKSKGYSNIVRFYSGKMDIRHFGVTTDGDHDNTDQINEAINYLHQLGGGTLLFSEGTYNVRTVHLKSNVYLYLDKGAIIKALKGSDDPESSWFSSRRYRSGLSPTDIGPYFDPENYLTKQDVGHSYFRNAMFFGERLDNVKIIGNGRITGDGNLATGDKLMNNLPGNRADKMFSFKLCTNVEIGGIGTDKDLWYDPEKDEPYYIDKSGGRNFDCGSMLNIDRGGHFVLLATGTDHLCIHDTWLGKHHTSNARDIYDFMGCNDVEVTNVYCKVSSDDIVKLGSDCSLGFTRPSTNFRVRNIIGDTNCNLFQIGSETADDITDVCVDNIYVLGGNKAGFSISTNDGGHVKDIHLNCGHTGTVHSMSEMYRTATPFFISVSNRGRVLGAKVSRYKFNENGSIRDELLCTNVNIGHVENIMLKGVNVHEVYGGSSYNGKRWEKYDGTQRKATPIIAGYKLPDTKEVEGGLNFILPDGKHTGYIQNIILDDIHVLVKGGNALIDSESVPRELGVGQYNVANFGTQPAYGLWARHVTGLVIKNSSFNYETRDSRYALFLDDVKGGKISSVQAVRAKDMKQIVMLRNSSNIKVEDFVYYSDQWGQSPSIQSDINNIITEKK